MGRVGDWTRDTLPYIVELQRDTPWQWVKVKLAADAVAWTQAMGAATNKTQLWNPGDNTPQIEENVALPRMIYLPTVVAEYLFQNKQTTALDLFNFIGGLIAQDDSGISVYDAVMLKKWCLAAGQVEPGKTGASSSVAVKLDQVMQMSRKCHGGTLGITIPIHAVSWLRRHVDTSF